MTDKRQLAVDWLQKQGYRLEYRVARLLRKRGYSVSRGRAYADPQMTDMWREVDLDAYRVSARRLAGDQPLAMHLVMECKHSEEPWVIFTDEPPDEALIIGSGQLERIDPIAYEALRRAFPASSVNGFMVATAGKSKGAFESLYQAFKGAYALSSLPLRDAARVVLPVIVTDAEMFAADYTDSGKEQLAETKLARIYFNSPLILGPVIVDVVHIDALEEYVAGIESALDGMTKEIVMRRPPRIVSVTYVPDEPVMDIAGAEGNPEPP